MCTRVFGFMCTADVVGFAQSQFYTVPFLVLSKLVDCCRKGVRPPRRQESYSSIWCWRRTLR